MPHHTDPMPTADWWLELYESPDALPLSCFPTEAETQREVEGLLRLLRPAAGQRLVDLCCGAGRHLLPLARRGLDLTGLDTSAMMLGRARRAAQREGLAVRLVRGDARRLPFPTARFDAALNLFNSFGYCETEEQNEQVLREAARILRPDGQLLLETRNPQFQILFAPLRQTVRAADGSALVLNCRYDQPRRRLEMTWSRPRRGLVVHRAGIRLYQPEELEQMAARAGLEPVGVYGDLEGQPFAGWQRLLVMHWRRPG